MAKLGRSRRARRSSWPGGLFAGVVVLGSALLLFQPVPPTESPRIAVTSAEGLRYQLGGTWATFGWGLRAAGAQPVVLDHDAAGEPEVDQERARALLIGFDGLVLGGGKDVQPQLYGADPDTASEVNPQRDRFELALLQAAQELDVPVLGVCRGIQIMNVFLGGTLRNLRDDEALSDAHDGLFAHDVKIRPDSRLARAYDVPRLDGVPSFHGQAVDRLGKGLRATAWGAGDVVEGVETAQTQRWWVGVQWHPELPPLWGAESPLFEAFVARVHAHRRSRLLERASSREASPEAAFARPTPLRAR